MVGNFDSRPGRTAGPLLASTLVLLLGAIGVVTIVVAGGGNPVIGGVAFLGIVVALPLFLLLLRATPVSSLKDRWGWMVSRENREVEDYQPRAIKTRKRYGTNTPPSAEDVRESKDNLNTWVPAGNKARSKPRE